MDTTRPSSRRHFILGSTAVAGLTIAAPAIPRSSARAAEVQLGPYQAAKINWKQAEGETITVAVIPASYFDNLISLQPQFEALTGIKVRFEKVPPGQIRQKAMLDLSSKTGDVRDARGRPDVLPAVRRRTNGSSRSTSTSTTRAHRRGLVQATTTSSRPGATPTRSTASPTAFRTTARSTVQVYRKDLYDAKGLKPADTLDELRRQRRGAQRPGDPHLRPGAARLRRRRPEHVHLSVALPRVRRQLVQGGKNIVVNSPEAVKALDWYVDALTANTRRRRCATGTGPTSPMRSRRARSRSYIDAHSSAAVINNPEKSKVDRQDRLSRAGRRARPASA